MHTDEIASVVDNAIKKAGITYEDIDAVAVTYGAGLLGALLVGVNIGGVGTLISSLASLITFREYTKHNPGKSGKYILLFSAFNFGMLIILTLAMSFIL